MAFILHDFVVPAIPAGLQRSNVIPLQLPQGSEVLGILNGDGAKLIVRGDIAQPNTTFSFVVVRSDVGLQPEEAAAQWVGSITGYRTAAGLEVYHVLRLLP